ncbi:hypothetical protein SAMN04488070_1260 [Pseudidiomarina maritima]|uniref:Uncharacterized protein n=2 Tax=Pseudidiomarina maritima TaxID=519453 RepID=A0A1I6GVA8_9GAMM|nr:hypothetical protein SAMN04488070_1260 [Pseudidiomarina maritima]
MAVVRAQNNNKDIGMRRFILTTLSISAMLCAMNIAWAQTQQNWIETYPANVDTLDAFFLEQDCDFLQNAGHVFDLASERWLSAEEVSDKFPQISEHIFDFGCDFQTSRNELEKLINYPDALPTSGYALIYFDLAVADNGKTHISMFSDSFIANYNKRVQVLGQFDKTVNIRVLPSLVGTQSP